MTTSSLDALGTARSLALGNTIANTDRNFFNLSGTGFADTLNGVIQDTEMAGSVDYASGIDAQSLSFEEYKQWIRDCINDMERSESRKDDSIAVELPDAAVQKMQADPQYANWILNEIRKDFAVNTVTKENTQAFALSRLNTALDRFVSERWLTPSDASWGPEMFQAQARNSFWIGMNTTTKESGALREVRERHAEMAAQLMLQDQVARSLSAVGQ